MVLVYRSVWSPGQVLANLCCFSFLLQVSELEENVNMKIRYQEFDGTGSNVDVRVQM